MRGQGESELFDFESWTVYGDVVLYSPKKSETADVDQNISTPVTITAPVLTFIEDDWVHDPNWVRQCIEHLLPPPVEATTQASRALQRELKALLREQESARSLKELGWYMSPDVVEENDNLFQWIVEVHSFDDSLFISHSYHVFEA